MNKANWNMILVGVAFVATGCISSEGLIGSGLGKSSASSQSAGGTSAAGGLVNPHNSAVGQPAAGSVSDANVMNASIPGTGSVSVATSESIAGRLEMGMSGNVSRMAGNFKSYLALAAPTLPNSANPMQATGQDQIPLLAFAACTDVSNGMMMSAYGVDATKNVTMTKTALVAAGVKILNRYVANLASDAAYSSQVNKVFSDLVDASAAANGGAATVAATAATFIAVCTTANQYGISMMGI